MVRFLVLIALASLAGCAGNQYYELPQTSKSDPIWQLNDGKWTFHENDLIQPAAVKP